MAWPPPVYHISVEFDAPLSFVFRWCTDYRTDDARRSGARFERRILHRAPREVVYEDLWWLADGWRWRRYRITLRPPDRWHADSVGNERDASLDYHLTALPGDRTRLDIVTRRRPASGRPGQPSRRTYERDLRQLWTRLARELQKDLGRSRARSRTRGGSIRARMVGRSSP